MKNRLNFLWKRIKHSYLGCLLYEGYQVLKATWFGLVSILFGAYALLYVEQAADVLRLMAQDSALLPDFFLFFFTALWAYCLWYCSRLVLRAAGIRIRQKNIHYAFHEWVPRVYALFPFLILILAYLKHSQGTYPISLFLPMAAVLLLAFYYLYRHRQIRQEDPSLLFPFDSLTLKGAFSRSKRPVQVFSLIATYSSLLLVLVFLLPTASSRTVAVGIGPAGIIVFGLTFWTFMLSVLAFADHKTKLPVSLLVLLLIFLFSFWNNNHLIRTFDRKERPFTDTRLPVDEHLTAWLSSRQAAIDSAQTEYPVFLIAAEGGGIRAAYWTASVLAELQAQHPSFYRHVYAISGVSGGSLGATVFTGLLADGQKGKLQENVRLDTLSRQILQQDFLSPLNAALLFPDLFQKAIPYPVRPWDRSRWLEDAWSAAYANETLPQPSQVENTMDAPFLDLWDGVANTYQVPALLLNGTRAETGEKTIVSNIRIDHATFGAIDLQKVTGEHIPLKTATLLSARFPLVTPAGAVDTYSHPDAMKKTWGHVVDGGYIDNSGLETAMTLVYKLQQKKLQERGKLQKLKVYLLYIKNSSPYRLDASGYADSNPISFMYEMRAPVQAFLGSWDKGSEARVRNTRNYFTRLKGINAASIGDMLTFELDRSKGMIPLGWYLSPTASREIDKQLENPDQNPRIGPLFQQVRKILEQSYTKGKTP